MLRDKRGRRREEGVGNRDEGRAKRDSECDVNCAVEGEEDEAISNRRSSPRGGGGGGGRREEEQERYVCNHLIKERFRSGGVFVFL